MMRLAILTPFLETLGGVDRVVLKIAEHFDASIHTVRYQPEKTFPEFRNLDIQVHSSALGRLPLGERAAGAIGAGDVFYNLLLKDYDLVNAHQTPSEWARNKNAPMIFYCHSPNREAFDLYDWRMGKRNLLQKAIFWTSIQAFRHFEFETVPKIEYIFTNSRNSQERIKKYLNRDSEVLYPGVDLERFGCKDFEKFFLYPSRIVPEKRIEFAIEAFKRFRKSNPGPGWKLVISGSVSGRKEHLDYFERLKNMAVPGSDIEFRTNISDEELLDLYARCFCILYSPINEDFGLVPLEGFAASKPCIAVNEGGPRETVEHGTDGFLVDGIAGMAKMMRYLSERPELAQEMGRKGRKKAEAKFMWKQFLSRFEEKAEELIKEKNE